MKLNKSARYARLSYYVVGMYMHEADLFLKYSMNIQCN